VFFFVIYFALYHCFFSTLCISVLPFSVLSPFYCCLYSFHSLAFAFSIDLFSFKNTLFTENIPVIANFFLNTHFTCRHAPKSSDGILLFNYFLLKGQRKDMMHVHIIIHPCISLWLRIKPWGLVGEWRINPRFLNFDTVSFTSECSIPNVCVGEYVFHPMFSIVCFIMIRVCCLTFSRLT